MSRIQSESLGYWNNDSLPEIQIYARGEVYVCELLGRPQCKQKLLSSRQDHINNLGYSKRKE